MQEYLKIPKDRIAVLIGKNGETRKELQKLTKTKIEIDSKTGEVDVQGEEPIDFYISLNIIKAIARGFSPEHAFLLKDENFFLEIIELKEILGKNEKLIQQKKGRVIGKKGKTRKEIEEKTDTFISVYGNTVSIIGKQEDIQKAKKVIEMLLEGASHSTAESFLFEREKEFEL
ncbi:KH domain-containing protein [Candidatus Micrarchaeota archaeon]|nr:KH domain-containing protein [Candidatus Micrarchaeota archaeon]MBU2476377.1 KH domain-containing protein [Candidatus Micrarchaeota archaeon]